MKRITEILFSSKTTIILLLILAVAMGSGTFIEDKYDTLTARTWVYNTIWFESLFILLAINFLAHIKPFKMMSWDKFGGIIFHLAFIIMIFGAGLTRFFGYEGNMHIREGEESNILISSNQFLKLSVTEKNESITKEIPIEFGPFIDNSFHTEIDTKEKGKLEFSCTKYVNNAIETAESNVAGGKDLFELIVATPNGRKRVFTEKGQALNLGNFIISFENTQFDNAINVTESNGKFFIKSPFPMMRTTMIGQVTDTVAQDTSVEFKDHCVYTADNSVFVFKEFYKSAKKAVKSSEKPEDGGFDALLFDVKVNNKSYEAPVIFASGQVGDACEFTFDGVPVKITYGKKEIPLPFSIHLNKFILERYAGSDSPSSYASEVTVVDNRNNFKKDHRIFMNNVLDYDSFRFFQSSYDKDEKGTILSVNHDKWGTLVSYTGYILLAFGFIVTLFNSHSRFMRLRRSIVEIRKKRKAILATLALVMCSSSFLFAQTTPVQAPVNAAHADKFGHLITQSIDGRFEPVHSLAFDVLHKVAKKDVFLVDGKGEMDAMQVFMDMVIEPDFWKQQKIIYIKEQSVRDALGITTKSASFIDFFDANMKYKLEDLANEAFRKKPIDQNNFDKEVIKVDERVNILMMVFQVSILKLYPQTDVPTGKWMSWDEPGAIVPISGVMNVINEDLKLRVLNYTNITQLYFEEVVKATKSGDYSRADKVLGYISKIQRAGSLEFLPSEGKINAEVFYNKAQIFIFVKNCYGVLSILLLLLTFIDNVRTKKSTIVNVLLNISIVALAASFLYQAFGMGLRAYLLGYAPWSNGYEALVLVSFGTLLAGFSFVRYSKITLAATSLLAFFVLMTAGHSSYDPQLTNLTPVLKSYWLIIHVAVLTISYGFLGLGFILGIINMFIYLFKTKENNERLDLLILELSFINEMNLTVGLLLATIGTFLGGVWANESWGRYWGWDAKETWALVIVITYTLLLHIRFIPKMGSKFIFNVGSILSYSSVLMTFFGVNYFLSKGMHSYGAGDHAIFPLWAWIAIGSLVLLMTLAKFKDDSINKQIHSN